MSVLAETAPEMLDTLKTNSDHDWAGEPWFWLAVLALLNAKNGGKLDLRACPRGPE